MQAHDETPPMAATTTQEPQFAAFVAIDWADKKHYWTLRPAGGSLERGVLDNTPEAVEAWAAELRQRFGAQPIAVALEQRRGALQVLLAKYEQLYLYPVNPLTMSKYRDAWFPSGSKSDPQDADLLLEILTQHRDRLRRIDPDSPAMRLLQFQVENRRKLVDERTALSNKLKNTLKIYFPQIPAWFDNLTTGLVCDLLEKWPTLQELQKASPAKLEKFLGGHGMRGEEKIQKRVEEIRQAVPATNDAAVIDSSKAMVEAWVGQLRVLRESIGKLEKSIREVAGAQPDWAIFDSFPGAGDVMAPRLMAALGGKRDRFPSAHELQCFAGIAPVREASGNSVVVHIRWACPKFVRQTFHEWAACSLPECEWAKAYYDRMKAKGKSHHTAVRGLAFKWMRILHRCWRDGVPYSEATYLARFRQRDLPLDELVKSVQMP